MKPLTLLPVAAALALTLGCAGQQPVEAIGGTAPNAPTQASQQQIGQQQAAVSQPNIEQNEVRQVQEALNEAGHNAGPVDGIWGPRTQSAMMNFQESRGLDATGELDRESALALGFSREDIAAFEIQPDLSESDVRQVQERLNSAGYDAGPVDGLWGPMTERGLTNFQEAQGLEASGQLDRETVLALDLPVSDFAAGEFSEEPSDQGQQRMDQEQRDQRQQ